jgi:hypothetical protein
MGGGFGNLGPNGSSLSGHPVFANHRRARRPRLPSNPVASSFVFMTMLNVWPVHALVHLRVVGVRIAVLADYRGIVMMIVCPSS